MTSRRWTSVATRSSRHGLRAHELPDWDRNLPDPLHFSIQRGAGGLTDAPVKQEQKLTKDAEKELLKEAELLACKFC